MASAIAHGFARLGRISPIISSHSTLANAILIQLIPRTRHVQTQWLRSSSLRGLRRTPVKVILPDGEEVDHKGRPLQRPVRNTDKRPLKNVNPIEDLDSYDSNGELPHYTKLGENTKLFTSVIQLTRNRKAREKQGKILLEGLRLIQDGIDAGVRAHSIFFSLPETLARLRLPSSSTDVKIYKVLYKDLSTWSNLTTCPGIMGVFHQPNYDTMDIQSKLQIPITLLCDNIRDPNNLGAIIRCAAAAGCDKVILTKGCVDVWDPKVLRSASGAHFHIRIEINVGWELVVNHVPMDSAVYLATSDVANIHDVNFSGTLDRDDDEHSNERIRTGAFDHIKPDPGWYEVTDDGRVRDPSYADEQVVKRYRTVPLKKLSHSECDFGKHNHVTLVIGGETEGLSNAAYKLAHDREGGVCVGIPLDNGVDSLNSAVAAGILIFEAQRQLLASRRLANRK